MFLTSLNINFNLERLIFQFSSIIQEIYEEYQKMISLMHQLDKKIFQFTPSEITVMTYVPINIL